MACSFIPPASPSEVVVSTCWRGSLLVDVATVRSLPPSRDGCGRMLCGMLMLCGVLVDRRCMLCGMLMGARGMDERGMVHTH
jgi:hypothetical protein